MITLEWLRAELIEEVPVGRRPEALRKLVAVERAAGRAASGVTLRPIVYESLGGFPLPVIEVRAEVGAKVSERTLRAELHATAARVEARSELERWPVYVEERRGVLRVVVECDTEAEAARAAEMLAAVAAERNG